MKADDFGNYTANTKLLKAALFPLKNYSEFEINDWLSECINAGIILKYSAESKDFINIPNFGQRLRAMKSHFPDIGQANDRQLSDNRRPETKRNEVETEDEKKVQIFGDSNDKNFLIVQSQIVNSPIYKVHGVQGLNDFLHSQMSVLNYPEHAAKFMSRKNGDRFNDMQHLRNAYAKFVEKQYA